MSDSGFLHKYFLENGKRQSDKWIHYLSIYEKHFSRFRNKKPTILEIGVQGGGSLTMWKEYFGEGCRVIGLDIDPECKKHADNGIEIFIGSQDDPSIINQILQKYPNIDIVLDDGSHFSAHMINTFNLLYYRMHENGVYMIEDMHACYSPSYNGGVKKPDSCIEFFKDKIDEINALWTNGDVEVSQFTKCTNSIVVYDSVIAIERKPQGNRKGLLTLPMGTDPYLVSTMELNKRLLNK